MVIRGDWWADRRLHALRRRLLSQGEQLSAGGLRLRRMPNNRELASLIWLGIALIWAVSRADIRASLRELCKSAVSPKIIGPLGVMALYVGAVVYVAREVGLWKPEFVTATVVWFVGSAVALMFSIDRVWKQRIFLLGLLVKVVGLAAIAEFVVNLYVLPLAVELVLVPITALLAMVTVVARTQEQQVAKRFAERLLAWSGWALVIYVAARLATDWDGSEVGEEALGFAAPVWLTVAVLPLVYLLALFAVYETAFMRLRFAGDSRDCPGWARAGLLAGLHVRGEDVAAFNGQWARRVRGARSFHGARRAAHEFRAARRAEARALDAQERRLERYAGVEGADEDGRRLDQREFEATRCALRHLQIAQMGWYRNQGGRYRTELLEILATTFEKCGLAELHGVELHVSDEGQAWWAWRRTATGWCFAIGAAGAPPDEWLFDGPEPPAGFPGEDPAWGEPFGLDAINWH
jgi:hypothetical protein